MRYLAIAILSVCFTTLSGCGQKGDLYLPPEDITAPETQDTQETERPEFDREDERDGPIERNPVNVDRPSL